MYFCSAVFCLLYDTITYGFSFWAEVLGSLLFFFFLSDYLFFFWFRSRVDIHFRLYLFFFFFIFMGNKISLLVLVFLWIYTTFSTMRTCNSFEHWLVLNCLHNIWISFSVCYFLLGHFLLG